jgi:L-ascorbate metabolism protein UlaG (beta-lactamase superfamily)
MRHTLTWHGHSNFQIAGANVNILIDPFFEGNPSCKTDSCSIAAPDVVLVTHDHGDHVGQAVEICKQTGAMLGAVVGTAGVLVGKGLPPEQVLNGIGFNIGGTLQVKGAAITMTQAYHSSDSGVAVGYVITLEDGFTLYHAGDTGIFSGMELWGKLYSIDLAALPIGGIFTMDPRQAAMACGLLGCATVTPMHWGTFPVLEKSTGAFARHLREHAPDTTLLELKPGESTVLERRVDTCGCD